MALIGDKELTRDKRLYIFEHINLNRLQHFTSRTVVTGALLFIKLLTMGNAY